ncbi:MAG: glycosyl transferase, family 2 [Fibrobacteres bacterium]|nr:glycosyl transferase, family 2 [Fibrobacterota bacterium]
MHTPKYSLLLPVRNEAGRIDEVVRSVFTDLAGNPDWEVCFADDCSDDGTYERLRQLAAIFPFRLIRPEANLGRGAIRNLLAREALADMLVFLDGDCKVLPGFFRAWEGLDPSVAWMGKVSYESHPKCGFSRYLAKGSGIGKLRVKRDIPAAYFISQNFRMSKALFLGTGGFRTDLLGWGGEDTDMAYRLGRMGVPMRYRGEAEVRHPSVTGVEAYFARLFHFGRVNLPVLIGDHPEAERQFKLGFARAPWSLLFLNGPVFSLMRFLVTSIKGWPWPFPVYRYVIFNCYARGYRQAPPRRGAAGPGA